MNLLITLLVVVVVVYLIQMILGMLSLPEPIGKIVYIIFALMVVIYLLRMFNY